RKPIVFVLENSLFPNFLNSFLQAGPRQRDWPHFYPFLFLSCNKFSVLLMLGIISGLSGGKNENGVKEGGS
ncbi:hypothetical protein, partial [Aeromonas media]